MPKPSPHALIWSDEQQCYELFTQRSLQRSFQRDDEVHWLTWVDEHTAFAFQGQAGHLSVIKEARSRGASYWYAYSRQARHTYKRYLGPSSALSLTRLEETASSLTQQHSSSGHSQAPQESAHSERQQTRTSLQSTEQARNMPLQRSFPIESPLPLLATKLHPPRLPALLVERSHLLALLDGGHQQKLTLVQAPAGFGKTTLVTQWITQRQAQATAAQLQAASIAWLSLDEGDNDPIRFWSSVIASCQAFDGLIGQAALEQFSQISFRQVPLETILTLLLNDLTRFVQQAILVLEEYHLIVYPRLHESMAFFIEHLPANMHVIILTRSEPPLPLVRWRARGDLLEIHPAQLRFSAEETTTFLQQALPQIISQEAVHSLQTHLEGWAAGLRLLALSLRNQTTPRAIEDTLAQLYTGSATDRAHRPIQEFFLSEVLAVQPEPLQLFLLKTSILNRLTASLCDEITGREDSTKLLELVERSGFFLEALDSAGEWYRYHTLFAETMRAEAKRRLGNGAWRELSAAASRWYEMHAMLLEAIEAALAAQELERAARLIEKLNERAYFTEYHTMRRWLEQFPHALLQAHPMLCFIFAQARIFSEAPDGLMWRIEPAQDLLQMAEEGWRKQGNLFQIGILYAFRATFTVVHGPIAPAVAYAHQALQLLPPLASKQFDDHLYQGPPEWIEWHCGCLLTIAAETEQEGAIEKAHEYYFAAYNLSLNIKDRVFTRVIGRMLGDICIELGELRQAASYYRQTLAEPPWPDARAEDIFYAQTASGLIRLSYEWNELETAEQLAREASFQQYRGDFPYAEEAARTKVELLRLLLLSIRGEVAEAQSALSTLFVHLQATPHTHPLLPEVLIWQARLQLRTGDLAAAARTLGSLTRTYKELSPLQQQSIQVLDARLHLAQGEAETALPLLEQLLASALQGKHIIRALEIQLLSALTYAALKQGHEARRQLALVLAQTRSEGFLRLFLDEGEPLATLLRSLLPSLTEKPLRAYAQSLLHAFTNHHTPHSGDTNETAAPLLEPLSAQEQRVLRLLVAGRSNPEIATELIVSVNTVKGHVKNLYRKLDVSSRVEASATARRLKLI